MNAIQEIALMSGVITVFIVTIAVPVYFVLKRTDRRVKDGPRCRACGYDLRASRGEDCIECGYPLSPKGVWPIGKPTRGPAIIAVVLWSWLALIVMFSSMILWQEYEHDVIQHHAFSTDLAILYTNSGKRPYTEIAISAAGNRWVFLPGDKATRVGLEQVTIWVYQNNTTLEVVPFSPATGETEEPTNPTEQNEFRLLYGSNTPPEAQSAEAYLTDSLQKLQNDPSINEDIAKDMAQVIELAQELSSRHTHIGYKDIVPYAMDVSVAHDLREPLRFARVTGPDWQEFDIEFAPWWISLIILGIFVVLWATGLPLIRRRVYERMAVDGVNDTA